MCREGAPIPHLYAYDENDLTPLLDGWRARPQDPYQLTRNWQGTRLYLRDPARPRRGVAVSREGRSPFEFPESGLLDGDGRLVAWSEPHGKENPPHEVLRFANGRHRVVPVVPERRGGMGVDPTGRYYFYDTVEVLVTGEGGFQVPRFSHRSTELARVDDPGTVLVRLPFSTEHLFLRDDRLYVFGPDLADSYRGIAVHVVRIRNGVHEIEREHRISQPRGWRGSGVFGVLDMDLRSDRVLLRQEWDWPRTPQWWLYDLATGELTALGPGKKHGFFLPDDILGDATRGMIRPRP